MVSIKLIFFYSFFLPIKMCEYVSHGLDLKTPLNVHLTAFYKRSFAYHTVKNRMPIILTQTIDGLARGKDKIAQEYGTEAQEDLKLVIGELSKLKYEIQTDKPLRKINSQAADAPIYNSYITGQKDRDGNATFFSSIWLLAECYMYRRIREAFELTNHLKDFDTFAEQKREAYMNALPIMSNLAQFLTSLLSQQSNAEKSDFTKLVKINLWGNKCDLSLSNGTVNLSDVEQMFNVEGLNTNILSDHTDSIWNAISNDVGGIIDIVCDNSGYELFTDFCVADYLISTNLASSIRFHVKTIPWFVSDVMVRDFYWMLQKLCTSSDIYLKKLGQNWTDYIKNKTWVVFQNDFWTLPMDFSYMASVNPILYKQLAEAKLVIFKGDLNYRKLFGEKNWDPVTAVDDALQNFNPTKLCTLRTIKADIVCGLAKGVAEKTEAINSKWMEIGDYGLIQFSDKVVQIK